MTQTRTTTFFNSFLEDFILLHKLFPDIKIKMNDSKIKNKYNNLCDTGLESGRFFPERAFYTLSIFSLARLQLSVTHTFTGFFYKVRIFIIILFSSFLRR